MYEIRRRSWAEAVALEDVNGWVPLDESGFDAAIAWCVPEGCLGCVAVDDSMRTIDYYDERSDGLKDWRSRPFTADDRQKVDDLANWYLGEAGIPPAPSGFRWYIKESQDFGPRTADEIMNAIFERGGSAPEEIIDDLVHVIPVVYR